MAQFTTLSARAVPLPVDNIDTDQIIPARFLKTTEKSGLGSSLFADWRYQANGALRPEFPLNDGRYAGAQILVAGDNFGCGSSREHAPWALVDYGFQAVISTSFADIFRNNSLKNGLLPIIVDPGTHASILHMVANDPACELTIDLETQQVHLPDGRRTSFPIDAFSKKCLLNGIDELGYLLSFEERIAAYEAVQY
jgi:3-isopropylmalate/(R)-2-methylmalate dehydratase small subunit